MGVIMKFLGTGASEGIPNPFCSCPVCENARRSGGPDIRMRSAFRVTDEVQIDYGPDTFAQSVILGNEMRTLKHLLITHAHDDHLAMFELALPGMVYGNIQNQLHVYLTENNFRMLEVFDGIAFEGKKGFFSEKLAGKVEFVKLEYGREYEIGDLRVTPVQASHACFFGSCGANYLLRLPDGKKLLYAVDTALYHEETIKTLRNAALDYLIAECTCGSLDRHDPNHMNINDCNALFESLYRVDAITQKTRVYLTHFSHKQSFSHADMEEYYRSRPTPCPVSVAYDGLTIAE
jgi:phosphoribosyl 1,2-cyclic phosphate phosphodiesterase